MFDGGSRGNPGICGCGYVIYKDGEKLLTGNEVVSKYNTSNFAEYMALILGLRKAIDESIRELYVEGDSMLVIKQVSNEWAVKSPNLIPLYKEVKELCNSFTNIKFEHVKRENNKTADALVNSALDEIDS
jgi:ribonuclease HI